MTVNFECVVPEEFSNAIVGLHDLSLALLIARDDHNRSVLSKHHLEIVLLLLVAVCLHLSLSFGHRLGSLHLHCPINVLLAL